MRTSFVAALTVLILILSLSPAHGAGTPGTLKRSYDIAASPTVGTDGTLYFPVNDVLTGHGLHAINPDGTLKWTYTANNTIISAPSVGADGTIYVGMLFYNFLAINPDGTLKWSYYDENQSEFYQSAAIGTDGTIYVGAFSHIFAFNPDGTLKWSHKINEQWTSVQSSPAIGRDGTIYVPVTRGKIYAVNPDGTLKWSSAVVPGAVHANTPLAIGTDGTIYMGNFFSLYAVNPDGTLKWSFPTKYFVESSPAVGPDGTIYLHSRDANLYAINPDGTLKWKYGVGGARIYWADSSPAIGADGTIYVGSQNRKLYAINPDGTLKWSYLAKDWVDSSPVIVSDGTIYVLADKLLAIYSSSFGLANAPWPMTGHDARHTGSVAALPALTVTKAGAGTGTVTSAGSEINCGANCSHGYPFGTSVTLNAQPDAGYTFTGWSNGCAGTGACTFTMYSDSIVRANFNAVPFTLTAAIQGDGTVSATGLTCGKSGCTGTYPYNTAVTLTAVPKAGAGFVSWTGCDATDGTSCLTTIRSNTSVTAAFTIVPCTYTISPARRSFTCKGGSMNVAVRGKGIHPCGSPDVTLSDTWFTATLASFRNNAGSVRITVPPNTATTGKNGTATIGGQAFAVAQAGTPCAISAISAPGSSLDSSAQPASFTVTVPTGCAWSASVISGDTWLTIPSVTENTVNYTVKENADKRLRSGRIKVYISNEPAKSRIFTVRQAK